MSWREGKESGNLIHHINICTFTVLCVFIYFWPSYMTCGSWTRD